MPHGSSLRLRLFIGLALSVALLFGFGTTIAGAAPPPTTSIATTSAVMVTSAANLPVSVLAAPAEATPTKATPTVDAGGENAGPDGSAKKLAALAGYLAYGLMWFSLVFGILITTGLLRRGVRRSTVYGAHMTLVIATIAFSVFHAMTYLFVKNLGYTPVSLFVPFLAKQDNLGVGLGIIALELAIAVACSVWIQRLLTYRVWHFVHYASYAVFVLMVGHTVMSSSEVRAGGIITLAVIGSVAALGLAVVIRVLPPKVRARIPLAPVEA